MHIYIYLHPLSTDIIHHHERENERAKEFSEQHQLQPAMHSQMTTINDDILYYICRVLYVSNRTYTPHSTLYHLAWIAQICFLFSLAFFSQWWLLLLYILLHEWNVKSLCVRRMKFCELQFPLQMRIISFNFDHCCIYCIIPAFCSSNHQNTHNVYNVHLLLLCIPFSLLWLRYDWMLIVENGNRLNICFSFKNSHWTQWIYPNSRCPMTRLTIYHYAYCAAAAMRNKKTFQISEQF